jgi:DNA-binding transcriptional LysR family regulator
MQQDLSGLQVFLAVAQEQGFRAAGERLGVTGSAVSQTLRQLEDRLGVTLVQRTTRSVSLTEAGAHLYDRLEPAIANVQAALDALDEVRKKPHGTLRLSVSSIADSFLTSGLLAEFLALHPDIKLDIAIDDGEGDIIAQGFDAGVRLGETVAPDMVAVSVSGAQRQLVVGAPSYFAQHPKPQHPRDLHGHSCIGWRVFASPQPYRWEFSDAKKEFEVAIDARVNTNDMALMIRLACTGVGITIGMEESFAPYLARGELVTVLERFCPPFPGFYLYYPKRAHTPLKLKVLVDFLRKRKRRG